MNRPAALCIAFLSLAVLAAHGQDVSFSSLPPGYVSGEVPLGTNNSASALAQDPDDDNFIYVAGMFGGEKGIIHLDLRDGAQTRVFACPTTVSVNGFAVLRADVIFISDNANDRLYVLRDDSPHDGDFDDPGEIRALIEPILTHPTLGWTGVAVTIVRTAENRLGLPSDTVLFQSEDGGTTQSEVLAVITPLTSPTFQPPGGAFFSGFNYGGGLAIDSKGRLLVASSFYPETGKVWICDDVSGDGVIGESESNILLTRASATTEAAGLSALAIDAADNCYVCVGMGYGPTARSDIQTFAVPWDPLHTTATVRTFGALNSPYVTAMIFNTPSRFFAPYHPDGAILVLLASGPMWDNLDYLLTVQPAGPSGVRQWQLY
ncbi:hypothetical protein AMJ85_02095 [candidate division BRC1 bacterium SM23_51]|nr:MAG: hypothetical protein AMJ85_02095 [candidate division BRC1 bacterium SM23_51]